MSIGIGVIRLDLGHSAEFHASNLRVLEGSAKRYGHPLAQIFEYDADSPTATQDLIAAIHAFGADVVHAPYRAHVIQVESQILEHAALVCVLDNLAWGRKTGAGQSI